ncbi:MAG TPA: nucleoside-diphosphate sugar epimerase [Lentisphaeria bacterium]|nr:MAG: nucleoside-diphosphate sugar epimerase [Lentisphaerae bacterium GWF2_50_93]HCE46560.1 nucleoside-diphosphate sugar epimerase [Lentisphaeria bacterium]
MKYLVTGGAGFIGSHLVESLLKDGHSVTVVDDFSTGSRENLAAVIKNPRLDLVEGDILNLPELEYLITKSDMVFHLAAAVGVELVVHDPVRTIVTNVHGTERVLRGAERSKTKVLIASTSEVYGKSEKVKFNEDDDLLIGPSTNCRWSYACSKLLDEFFGMAYYRAEKMPVVIVRFFNTVGPRQTGRYGMVLPRFVSKALKNEALQVYGDGEQSRCFCHVYDAVRALRLIADCDGAVGKIFNIGNTEEVSMNALAAMVIKRLKSKAKVKHIAYEKAYESGFEDMRRRLPDISKINKATGWKPEHNLSQIIDSVAAYFKKKKS